MQLSRLISSCVASWRFFSGSSVSNFSYFLDLRPRKGAKMEKAPGAMTPPPLPAKPLTVKLVSRKSTRNSVHFLFTSSNDFWLLLLSCFSFLPRPLSLSLSNKQTTDCKCPLGWMMRWEKCKIAGKILAKNTAERKRVGKFGHRSQSHSLGLVSSKQTDWLRIERRDLFYFPSSSSSSAVRPSVRPSVRPFVCLSVFFKLLLGPMTIVCFSRRLEKKKGKKSLTRLVACFSFSVFYICPPYLSS